jgi:cytochrome c biogenesis protein
MWKNFYSMKTALILIALIVLLSIVGTFQATGAIYHSYLYQGLVLLLIINTLLCTSKRLPQLLLKIGIRKPSFNQIRRDFPKSNGIRIPDPDVGIEKLSAFYHDHRYRATSLQSEQEELIYARKGIVSVIAGQIIHWALIIVFTGAFIGSFGSTTEVTGGIGQINDLPKLLNNNPFVQIRIDDFTTIYNPDRSVENWATRLTLLEGEKELAKGMSMVNHPFHYQGVTFYQSGYGYQCNIELNQNGMAKEYKIPVNQVMNNGNKAFVLEKKAAGQYTLKVFENNRESRAYELNQGTVIKLVNQTSLKLLGESAFTVLKIKTDPGNTVVMVGLVIGALGFILLYTGQYQEVKVLVHRSTQTAQISVYCKNGLLKKQITNEVTSIIGGQKIESSS